MKLGHYYGLVKDNQSNSYQLLKIQRIKAGESTVEAYTRWIKELEQTHQGRYTTMGLSFGPLRIEYDAKKREGLVKVGFSTLGMITPKPSIQSRGMRGVAGQAMYLSGAPNVLHDTSTLNQIRDALFEHINDAVWVL